jgi:two-component system cell cycle response regulator DivK
MPERKSILVVEDNEQSMELVEFLLEEAGLEVQKAVDAASAIEEFQRHRPDLVLMDMNLPGRDGLSVVGELRTLAPGTLPIVALTALAMRGDRERFLAGGCDGYISKPIDVSTFVEQVGVFLAR